GLWCFSLAVSLLLVLMFTEVSVIDPLFVARILGYSIPTSAVVYFIYVLLFQDLDQDERKKVMAMAIFFIATGLFYAGYEQQGSSLNLFAKRYTDMFIGTFEMPASWLQTVPPV